MTVKNNSVLTHHIARTHYREANSSSPVFASVLLSVIIINTAKANSASLSSDFAEVDCSTRWCIDFVSVVGFYNLNVPIFFKSDR